MFLISRTNFKKKKTKILWFHLSKLVLDVIERVRGMILCNPLINAYKSFLYLHSPFELSNTKYEAYVLDH
jgi:hypothetical protein